MPVVSYAPANVTYTLQMQYVFNMQNASGSLSPECQVCDGPSGFLGCVRRYH